jgi:hypothetical protein
MKKVFSTIAAALVALAFAGTVLAADAPKTEAAPAIPAGHPAMTKEAAKPAKKAKKVKKAKKAVKKEAAKPAEAPAAAPAAK